MVFNASAGALWAQLWWLGGLMVLAGGYWFWFFIRVDVAAEGGQPGVSIYRAEARPWPLPIGMLERHPLGSQLFMPLSGERFLVVVAPAAAVPDRAAVRAFVTNGHQGVNYRRGTWHHPLIALAGPGEFLVIDRAGPGSNCDEFQFGDAGIELQRPG